MPDEFTEPDWKKLNAFFAEHFRWVNLHVTIEEIAKENKSLIDDLSKYDPTFAIPLLASLLTLPKLQSHCIRLEILVTLAVVYCHGRKKVGLNQVLSWFSQIGKSQCVSGEDPAEDVFVSIVQNRKGDYRIIEGVWEAAGFYTQRIIDVIETMPDTGPFGQIKKSVRGLLVVSDLVCEKAGLKRYQLGSDEFLSDLTQRILPGRNALISRVMIAFDELDVYGVTPDDIEPFLLHPQMRNDLPAQQVGAGYIERCPLIVNDTSYLTVVLPTALSVAVRDYVISEIVENDLAETFNGILAQNYKKLFFDTPLLGGPMRAPVHWNKADVHRWSNFYFQIDAGYFISFHLFLPSVKVHSNGGFKGTYQEKGTLSEALQTSIDEVINLLNQKDNFKQGFIILVGCGWGKGYNIQGIEFKHPNWRFESISAADLVRLSLLGDMSPNYFWRIQDGLEAVEKAGVEIVNPNGILNLIGWARRNNGHLVPHEDLPEGEISPERPLMLNPPLNLLREVRADSDHGYDRHRAIDNIGAWHDVQHVSPRPFFSSNSERRIYASLTELKRGIYTSVYEGKLKLWMSFTAPNISETKVEYKLWEMANEWLHRIGNTLDTHGDFRTEKNRLKVYVEFHDNDLIKEKSIPTPEDIVSLCSIAPHSEPNACKAIFQVGFLASSRIAENIAERIFVRILAKAYLHLLHIEPCEDEARAIETLVVPNNDARSFHIIYAQTFADYVRETLPQKLITIEPEDDASAKIGLGWRVLGIDPKNKIEGKEECSAFLEKVVDTLLSEIIETLKAFDRLSALTRFVANSEKANSKRSHWNRTSAALLGLHGNEPGTIDRYVEQMSKFAGAGIASRILTEIALCVCPKEGGMNISDIEMNKLIACAALVIRFGGLSDAIYYNALTPELMVSPLGDILFRDDFGRLVVEPMVTQMMGDKFIANVPLQRKHYEEPRIIPETKGEIDEEFWDIWKIEMGFDLDEARNIIGALEDKGIEDNTAIFTIKESRYLSLVCSEIIIENTARRFLDQFSLSTRPNWDKPPIGFNSKDIFPWRFGRRLSFTTRPILKIDDNEDPLLIFAPGALRKSFVYVFDGAYNGRLEQTFFQTKEMRNIWWGKASEGHTFNAEVAKALLNKKWRVRENIGLPELLNQKFEQDYGDIDVLAWRIDRKEVLVIECKDLAMARNYSEIAALLSDYQGAESGGKPDKLKRHLNRIEIIQKNRELVERFTGIQELQIVSCLACSGVVPMQFANISALENTFVGGIPDLLKFCEVD